MTKLKKMKQSNKQGNLVKKAMAGDKSAIAALSRQFNCPASKIKANLNELIDLEKLVDKN